MKRRCGRGGMVDTHASGACGSNVMRVQISSSAPFYKGFKPFLLYRRLFSYESDKMKL